MSLFFVKIFYLHNLRKKFPFNGSWKIRVFFFWKKIIEDEIKKKKKMLCEVAYGKYKLSIHTDTRCSD